MPTARKLLAGLALAFTAISCTDKGPTESNTVTDNQTPSAPTAPTRAKQALIGDVPAAQQDIVSDGLSNDPNVVPLFPAGTHFTVAHVQITKFYYQNGQLFVDGGLFDAAGAFIPNSQFTHAPAKLYKGGGPTQPTCPILLLDLGPLHLDLLGLTVDLNAIHLNISAQSGSGNLLGNLLCAVANLLNGTGGLGAAITNLLNQINALLAALLAGL